MFIELDKIKQLEVELSTYCNAACPGCSRHYWGTSDKLPNLIEEHLDVDIVTKVIKQIILHIDNPVLIELLIQCRL